MRLGSPSPQPFSAQAENPDATDAKLKSEPMDSAEAKLPSEATEPMEANDPAEPIDSTEPVEPMERIDPLEPIDRIDQDEPMLRMEPPALPAPEELTLPMKAFWHRHRPGSWSGRRPAEPPGLASPASRNEAMSDTAVLADLDRVRASPGKGLAGSETAGRKLATRQGLTGR